MSNLKINTSVKTTNSKHLVYCQESYAQELYNLMTGSSFNDLAPINDGDIVKAEVILKTDTELILNSNFETVFIDIKKEKKNKSFLDSLSIGNQIEVFVSKEKNDSFLKGSIEKAHNAKVRESLFESLYNNTCAFNCTVIEKSKGGFFVEIDGVKAFMPGSLAAANKLVNFDVLMGKQVQVMVENYIKDTDTFIVSNKKYIQHVLPTMIDELSIMEDKYSGFITGTTKFGAFVEWNDVFTGLLHFNEMSDEMKKQFNSFKPGQEVEFYIRRVDEITNKQGKLEKRIILTDKTKEQPKQ